MDANINPYLPTELAEAGQASTPLPLLGFVTWILIVPAVLILSFVAFLMMLEWMNAGIQVLPPSWYGLVTIAFLSVGVVGKSRVAAREFFRGSHMRQAWWAFAAVWVLYALIMLVVYLMTLFVL